jgi:hypothetical protein
MGSRIEVKQWTLSPCTCRLPANVTLSTPGIGFSCCVCYCCCSCYHSCSPQVLLILLLPGSSFGTTTVSLLTKHAPHGHLESAGIRRRDDAAVVVRRNSQHFPEHMHTTMDSKHRQEINGIMTISYMSTLQRDDHRTYLEW